MRTLSRCSAGPSAARAAERDGAVLEGGAEADRPALSEARTLGDRGAPRAVGAVPPERSATVRGERAPVRRLGILFAAGLLTALAAFFSAAAAEVPIPPLKAHVTDLAGTLTPDQQRALEEQLSAFERRKGSQIAVVIVPTTQPETIEQYSIRLAEAWKVGRRNIDDGVILLVAKNDRRLRIEVGYGLEGAIPDAIAKRIVSDVIAPHLRAGDYFGGIAAGTAALMRLIEGEPLPLPAPSPPEERGVAAGSLIPLVLVVLFASVVLVPFTGRFVAALGGGAAAGVIAGALYGVLAGVALGALVFFLVLIGLFGGFFSAGGPWGGGGWYSGGWSGGGFSGWSGGGGSFGGGGASGSW